MTSHADAIRLHLAIGPQSGTQLAKAIGVSQPTVSRALRAMGDAVMRAGQKRGTRYFLRDHSRGFSDVPVYRVDVEGKLKALGVLTPVRADGYVLHRPMGDKFTVRACLGGCWICARKVFWGAPTPRVTPLNLACPPPCKNGRIAMPCVPC